MSKTMTRFLSLLLIAVLAISLCGCGGEGKKTESNQIKLEDYEILYKDACIMTDSDGNDAVVLTLDFTNNSKESASYIWSINETLVQNGVDTLICGGIGGGAQAALAEAGIKLYGGVSGDADAAVSALLNGNLGYDPNVHCDHHDHEHGEAGHSCGDHGCGKHSCH